MSKCFYYRTKEKIDIPAFVKKYAENSGFSFYEIDHSLSKLENDVNIASLKNVPYVLSRITDKVFYIYFDRFCAKGINISEEKNCYEFRLTILSNWADYDVAVRLAGAITFKAEGYFTTEHDDKPMKPGPIIESKYWEQYLEEDYATTKAMVELEKSTVTVFCPKNLFHFGVNLIAKIEKQALEQNKTEAYIANAIMLHKLYKVELPYLNMFSMPLTMLPNTELLLQIIDNGFTYVISKADFYQFRFYEESSIFIPSDKLLCNLPPSWELLDECDFIAYQLPEDEYMAWIDTMLKHDVRPDKIETYFLKNLYKK